MDLERMSTEAPIRQQRLAVSLSDVPQSSRRWLVVITILLIAWVLLPWMAPILMKLGLDILAKPIYWFYSLQCHQFPQRSFFLFGPAPMLSLSEIQAMLEQTSDPIVLRQFIGNSQIGYKVAWSDRMVSAYTTIPLGGILWWSFRKRLPFLSIWGFLFLALPMGIDGITHMVSDIEGIGQGFRFTNEWLVTLTENGLPSFFYTGTTLGSFNSWMRLITGTLFGLGMGWFVFPRLALAFGIIKPTTRVQR
jgi:uncharacterized membrane protein